MVTVETFTDVAREFNRLYSNYLLLKNNRFKKGEKSKKFLSIFKSLFEKYGERFGYSNLSDFKSDVIIAKNNLKKDKNIITKNTILEPFSLSPILFSKKVLLFQPNEGSGGAFTEWQIANLGLNSDSY